LRFNDFIKDDFIPEGDGQVASGSASIPNPVALETEEQKLEREQNEHDVLEALGEYKCLDQCSLLPRTTLLYVSYRIILSFVITLDLLIGGLA
jgi:hypothetical protein